MLWRLFNDVPMNIFMILIYVHDSLLGFLWFWWVLDYVCPKSVLWCWCVFQWISYEIFDVVDQFVIIYVFDLWWFLNVFHLRSQSCWWYLNDLSKWFVCLFWMSLYVLMRSNYDDFPMIFPWYYDDVDVFSEISIMR